MWRIEIDDEQCGTAGVSSNFRFGERASDDCFSIRDQSFQRRTERDRQRVILLDEDNGPGCADRSVKGRRHKVGDANARE
jgi:hypothetical protein